MSENLINMGDRGFYHKKNPLNDLTGKEWIYFTNSMLETDFDNEEEFKDWLNYISDSVIDTRYSTSGEDGFEHKLRKQHPTPKPPQLMRDIIAFFTKEEQTVLDPFMGVGGTLIGASLINRNAIGIDLDKKYIDIYKEVSKKLGYKIQKTYVKDALKIDKIKALSEIQVDAIITDPPYANMMSKAKTGGDKTKKNEIGTPTPFTENKDDIGNLDYFEFLNSLKIIIEKSLLLLKEKGYLIVFTKDLQPTKQHHNMLHADIVQKLSEIDGLDYKGFKIWYDKSLNLFPYGYPYSYVSNQLHQYILIFRKG
jgi:DNA modification methylase